MGRLRKPLVDRKLNYGGTISAIYSDRYGNVWFGTNQDGVHQYSGGKTVSRFTDKDGLAGNIVKAIYEANDGKL